MTTISVQKVVILGCGNLAWHLAKNLNSQKKYSLFIYNHKPNEQLRQFKKSFNAKIYENFESIIVDSDYYFICVADRFIAKSAKRISTRKSEAVIIHTSGSASIKELGERLCDTAVFYPLQTFSKNDDLNWAETPIIIESSKESTVIRMKTFAKNISRNVLIMDYTLRLKMHLAAVLVNNFTNSLYVASMDVIGKHMGGKGHISLLLPLIKQTVDKLDKLDPHEAQTGPAKRGDKHVMKKHLTLLSKQSEMKKIYKQMSKLIVKQQENKHA